MSGDPFEDIARSRKRGRVPQSEGGKGATTWTSPIPDDAPPPPASLKGVGKASRIWTYRNSTGTPLFRVLRFDRKEGEKEFRPQTLWRENGRLAWRFKAAPLPRPLYGLDRLAARPESPVLLVEGEKAADAAAEIFPDLVAVTWCGGSKAGAKADWSPLSGRTVAILPDADLAGKEAAEIALAQLVGANAAIVALPDGLPKGWDVADPMPEGVKFTSIQNALARALSHAASQPGERTGASPVASPLGGGDWPHGFRMDGDGLWHDDGEKKPLRLSDPFEVVGRARDPEGNGWGLVVGFRDPDGRAKEEFVPYDKLAGQGAEVRGQLAAGGLWIATGPGAAARFVQALASARSAKRVLRVDRTGWTAGGRFVLPHRVIGGDPDEPARFSGDPRGTHYGERGDFSVWQKNVAGPIESHPLAAFLLCVAFAGPLLEPLGEDGGGFHLRGGSSSGKTTLAHLAGSVWGGAGPLGFAQSWRATSNALEGVAVAHSNTLLLLDELALVSSDEAGPAAYQLASGSAKNRSRADGGLRHQARWRVMILSTGEIGLADHVRSGKRGERVMAGQEVRLLDIDADAGAGMGVWSILSPEEGPAAFSDRLKAAAGRAFGTAGPAFVEDLCADLDAAIQEARRFIELFEAEAGLPGDTGQARRGARRFAVIAAAGEIAIRAGVLPWQEGAAMNAARFVFDRWAIRFGRSRLREDRAAMIAVRDALEAHQTKFGAVRAEEEWAETDRAGEARSLETWGFRWTAPDGERFFLFNDAGWKAALAGHDPVRAAKALKEAGLLRCDGEDRLKKKVRVRGRNQPFYAVSERLLEWDPDGS